MRSKELSWLLSHPEVENKYAGEYIAIAEDSIVAHGEDFKQVLKEAEKTIKNPSFIKFRLWREN